MLKTWTLIKGNFDMKNESTTSASTNFTIVSNKPLYLPFGEKFHNIDIDKASTTILAQYFKDLGANVVEKDNGLEINVTSGLLLNNYVSFNIKNLQDYYKQQTATTALELSAKDKVISTMYLRYQTMRSNPLPLIVGMTGVAGFMAGALTMRYRMR